LRDATGTVDSPALIASSIMSKKLAAGAGAIVLDVTVGAGAFMRERDEAWALAELMVGIGRRAGRTVGALLTDMDQPLGETVGNAIEVEEAARALRGRGPADVHEVSVSIAAWMLVAAGLAGDESAGRAMAEGAIASGAALDKFREMIAAQGGDPDALDLPLLGHEPAERSGWGATEAGYVTALDARGVGYAALAAGAGRRRKSDELDPAAGVRLLRKVGDPVEPGEILAEVTTGSRERLVAAFEELSRAYEIGAAPPEPTDLILDVIPPAGPEAS
jgi:pyrimidine-nucleoside phosphorylase